MYCHSYRLTLFLDLDLFPTQLLTTEASLIVQGFTISVNGSLCSYIFFGPILAPLLSIYMYIRVMHDSRQTATYVLTEQ